MTGICKDDIKVAVKIRCKFYMICNYYRGDSETCNNEDEKEWAYCGKYQEIMRVI